jgi:histidine triad (HIT) family protein
MSSIFSKIVAGEIPSYKVAEDDNFYAFLDINPMAKGHTLVIPKNEIDYIFDLDDSLLKDMAVFSKKVAKAIEKVIPCKRIGMMVIGMEVPHAHIHLIPISKESYMSLSNQRVKMEQAEFEEIARSIRENL